MKRMAVQSLILTVGFLFLAGCGRERGKITDTREGGAKTITLAGYTGLNIADTPQAASESTRQVVADARYDTNKGVVVEIKEKLFIAQTNDVYENPDDYLGKTLKLEGIFQYYRPMTGDEPYCFVMRYGPGCCGNDGSVAFEVLWENGQGQYPQEGEWVEAVGVLKRYEEDGYPYICISLSSLKVLRTRGAEFVTQ
ncbi:MAG: hypothetical protein LBD24_07055 [Spirochaetaceae bacterium]|nr:hypothetical protein [Spirochaetaceae bacterium]